MYAWNCCGATIFSLNGIRLWLKAAAGPAGLSGLPGVGEAALQQPDRRHRRD
jgi:hypothetical protein